MKRPNLKKNAPFILSCVAVVGVGTTAFLGIRAGMEADRILSQNPEAIEFKAKMKLTWKCYVLTIASMLVTGGCIIFAHKLNKKQIAALSSLAAASTASFNQYRDKVKEIIGVEEEKKLYDEVKKEVKWYKEEEYDFSDDDGSVLLWYDDYTEQYFRAKKSEVFRGMYKLNRSFNLNFYQTVNDYCRSIPGMKEIPGGEEEGWSVDCIADWGWDPSSWIDINILEYPKESTDKYGKEGECVHGIVFDFLPTKEALTDYGYL